MTPAPSLDPRLAPPRLEALLGDPFDGGVLAFERMVSDEGTSRLDSASADLLDPASLASELVPEALGGRCESAAGLVRELRPLFRRDPSAAVDLIVAPLAAASIVWECADPAQQEQFAAALMSGVRVAGRVADSQHVPVRYSGGEWEATGTSPLLAATARADVWAIPIRDSSGAATLLLAPVSALRERPIDSVETVGLRGTQFACCDLSGYRAAPGEVVRADDPIHRARASTRTRVIIAALAVATVDTAFQLALPYAAGRELYRGTVLDLPHARGLLAEARTDLLTADALAGGAVHAIDEGRADAAAAAFAATTLVPLLLNDAMRALSVLFGSTFYARVDPFAIFETLVRDVGSLSLLGLSGAASPAELARAVRYASELCRAVAQSPDAEAADEDWLASALQRLDSRITGRRSPLAERAIDSAVEDLTRCVSSGSSVTLDRIKIFGAAAASSSTTPIDEGSRERL